MSDNDLNQLEQKDKIKQLNQNLSEFLPSFMWVVRDFSLQLIDQNSNPITSKQYLEQALQDKGDASDPKN